GRRYPVWIGDEGGLFGSPAQGLDRRGETDRGRCSDYRYRSFRQMAGTRIRAAAERLWGECMCRLRWVLLPRKGSRDHRCGRYRCRGGPISFQIVYDGTYACSQGQDAGIAGDAGTGAADAEHKNVLEFGDRRDPWREQGGWGADLQ